MGLIYWLPMTDGTAKNQGLVNDVFTTSGPTANTSGKLGSCCYFNGSTHSIYTNKEFDYPQTTISCWFKISPDNPMSASQWLVCFNNSGSGTAANTLTGFYITTAIKLACQSRGHTYTYGTALSKNIWYHVCATSENGEPMKMYINGELVGEDTVAGTAVTATCLSIGGRATNNSGTVHAYAPTGMYMNDVRIYDNILSPREIKEISKGLVLHYPLAMPGQENLAKNTNQIFESTPAASGSTYAPNIYLNITPEEITTDAVFTVSFNFEVIGNDKSANLYTQLNGSAIANSTHNVNATDTSGRYVALVRPSTSQASDTSNPRIRMRINSTPTDGTVFKIWNVKFERGEVATPWIPATTDPEYTALGFDDGIEYDVSGYGHNGTKTGAFAYDADTPRYNTSTRFNLTDTRIAPPIIFQSDAKIPEISFSFWMKRNDYTDAKNHYIYNDICQIYTHSDYLLRISWKHDTESSSAGNTSAGSVAATTVTPNEWHHICYTFDKGYLRLYIDGEFKYDSDRTGTGQFMGVYNYRSIGYASGANISYGGCLSDFRIYSTALSADDILELYHTPETLSHNGTLLTQGEFVES